MTTTKPYENAPITEAIIDLRVGKLEESKLQDLLALSNNLSESYPTKFDRHYAEGTMQFGNEVSTKASQNHIGYLLKSKDEKNIFQARLDGFTLSRLAPYESWSQFVQEAKQLWEGYREAIGEITVSRLAVRYINRIEIPLPVEELSEYLEIYPQIPKTMPDLLTGLLMRLSIPHNDITATCLITQSLEKSQSSEVASVILDIDLYRDHSLPQTDAEIWEYLEELHIRKNDIFESCITEKCRELFK